MALDKDRLGAALWTKIKSRYAYVPAITPEMDAEGLALWKDISEMIIAEITGHAEVNPGNMAANVNEIIAPNGGGACTGNAVLDTGKGSVS